MPGPSHAIAVLAAITSSMIMVNTTMISVAFQCFIVSPMAKLKFLYLNLDSNKIACPLKLYKKYKISMRIKMKTDWIFPVGSLLPKVSGAS